MSASDSAASNNNVSNNPERRRRSRWATSWDAVKHVSDSFSEKGDKTRKSDKASSIMLVLLVLALTGYFLFPSFRGPLFIVGDLFFCAAVGFYIANRLGIMATLNKRQTVILSELMIGLVVITILAVGNVLVCREYFAGLLVQ